MAIITVRKVMRSSLFVSPYAEPGRRLSLKICVAAKVGNTPIVHAIFR
jgi:hypothetical protein